MVSHWSFSDSKSLQVSWIFSVFWLILIILLFGWFPVPVPVLWWLYRAHQLQLVSPSFSCSVVFSRSQARFRYLSLFSLSLFYPMVCQNGKVYYSAGSLFLLRITRSDCLAEIWWFVCGSKSQRSLCLSFSRTDSGLGIIIIITIVPLRVFHANLMVSQWSLSDSKSPQVSRILLSILTDLSNAVV